VDETEGGAVMDRRAWLDGQRASVEERYDRLYSQTYDDGSPITPTHRRFVERLIQSCPLGGAILDAPCGTGRYFEMVLAAGRRVVGIDQSAGMLARARAKHPDVELRKVGLQELEFDGEFDAALCIDAMEYVFPEDWPLVLAKLHKAVRGGGRIYLTVEQIDEAEIATVFAEARASGLPVVYGENLRRSGGYHFYPTPDRVSRWLAAAGLDIVEKGISRARTYSYVHILACGTAHWSGTADLLPKAIVVGKSAYVGDGSGPRAKLSGCD
jgi:SAM-dependent methyltransferase